MGKKELYCTSGKYRGRVRREKVEKGERRIGRERNGSDGSGVMEDTPVKEKSEGKVVKIVEGVRRHDDRDGEV